MKPAEASLPSDTEVLVKRSFDAPVKLVWRAYMEPDLMRRWCSGPCPVGRCLSARWICASAASIAGAGAVTRTARSLDSPARFWKSFRTRRSCIRKSSIRVIWAFPWAVNQSIITVTFQEANGITNVTTTIKYASKADRDAAFSTGMTDGMEMSYKRLDEVLAG